MAHHDVGQKMKIPLDYTITTDRCTLRSPAESDIAHVFSATRHAGFNDGMAWGPPQSPEELIAPLKRNLELWTKGESYTFTIVENPSGDFVGRIVIRKTEKPEVWNLGFWTHPNLQSRGFMTEAARAILRFGFTILGAEEIEACHVVWNKASRRVLEKIGMNEIEFIEKGLFKEACWIPEFRMSIKNQTTEPKQALEPTRMLVTDRAAHAPRQASVRLIKDVRQKK
jgi:[ribosomal protein S5]-alanine N-acetyltransferase